MRIYVIDESKRHLSCTQRGKLYWAALESGTYRSKSDLAKAINISRRQLNAYLGVRTISADVIVFLEMDTSAFSGKLLDRLKMISESYDHFEIKKMVAALSLSQSKAQSTRIRLGALELGLYVLNAVKVARCETPSPHPEGPGDNLELQNRPADERFKDLLSRSRLTFNSLCESHRMGRNFSVCKLVRHALLHGDKAEQWTEVDIASTRRAFTDLHIAASNRKHIAPLELSPGLKRIADTLKKYGTLTPRVLREISSQIAEHGDDAVASAACSLDRKIKMPIIPALNEMSRKLNARGKSKT